MCGIAGFLGEFSPAALLLASECQAHRGPDDAGEFFDEEAGVGLAHRRLSILDLSAAGHQPMHSEDGSVTLVFNGEIYNFRELREELVGEGVAFRGTSDTEVLLHMYLRSGAAMLSRLNGIFAFAVWDSRSSSLFVARDALGVKPLYFSHGASGFAFASEIKALLHLVPEARELDPISIHRYLAFLWCPGDGTPLKAVRKLGPGEALLVSRNQPVRRWQWYELPVFAVSQGWLNEREAIASTADLLRSAVHRQMVADVPVGAFLSGGLDSSAVTAFAREQAPDIQCFTIDSGSGSEEGIVDDLPYARRVARHLGVALHVVEVDASRMAADIETLAGQLDEPFADPAPLNVLYISRLARKHGMKVLLSGAGGDDLFTGYRRHAAVRFEPLWSWIPAGVRRKLETSSAALDQTNPLFRKFGKLLRGAALEGDERLAAYFLWADEGELKSLYTREFAEAVEKQRATAPLVDFLAPLPESVPSIDRMLALEQRFFLADHNLAYTDRMSMAAGVEVRVPFLDLPLVAHAARIPAALKQRGTVGKWVLKKAMEPYLPHDIIYRPKTGFGAPLRKWMRGDLQPLLQDVLSTDSLRSRGLFRPEAVHRLIDRNQSGEIDASHTLLSLLTIELWCRALLDKSVPHQTCEMPQ
jgi:asparagine synthase (glutamine-hydrolysing)